MQFFGPDALEAVLDFPSLIEALRKAFAASVTMPPRQHYHIEVSPPALGGDLLLMPAWQADEVIGIKIVSVFPGNAGQGLPAVSGIYVLLNGKTGVPLAMMDGTRLTLRRTAAASALAADYLARDQAARLLMVGTGALAPHLIDAHASVRPLTEVMIWGRNFSKADALGRRLAHRPYKVTAVPDLADAVNKAEIISCATLSTDPLIKGEWLSPGTHLDLVGGFRPTMREADDTAIRRSRVFVDTREGAMKEAGDIVQPINNGSLDPQNIVADLFDLTKSCIKLRKTGQEITLFKSVGAAIEDLAAARLAATRLF